jgi:predicted transcriptional regulator
MAGDDPIETISFQRASETALGVLLILLADSLFWPVRAELRLRQSLANRADQLAAALRRSPGSRAAEQEPSQQVPLPSSPLIPQLGLVDEAGFEFGSSPARARTFTRVALLLEGLSSRIRGIAREVGRVVSARSSPQGAALSTMGDKITGAITKASQALSSNRSPEPFADDLDRSLAGFEETLAMPATRVEPGAGATPGALEVLHAGTLAPALRDAVAVLRNLESALVDLARAEDAPQANGSRDASTAGWSWFRPDPIRVQLALRAAIAGGGALIAALAMGWGAADQLAVIMAAITAFIFAGASFTRGAGGTLATGLVAGVLLGWLVADLAIVYLTPYLSQMPMVLVYPFAVSGLAGYLIVRGSPLGPLGALFGLTTAILPIFSRPSAPLDVYASYSLVCGIMLGVVIGFIAQRLLWPRTAMQVFLQRSAGQLELCAQAAQGENAVSDPRDVARLLSTYAKQLAQLLQLHQFASREPVERALSDERRSKLLALTQALFDASVRSRRESTAVTEIGNHADETEALLAPLYRALVKEEEALTRSITSAAQALREDESAVSAGLNEAHAEVEAQIVALRGRDDLEALERQKALQVIAAVSSRRALVETQLQIEAWIADWRAAASADRAT